MEQYYTAGYFLIKTHPIDFGNDLGKIVSTCSGCINLTAFDLWALSWTQSELDDEDRLELGVNERTIKQIQDWTEKKFSEGKIGFGNVFPEATMAIEFKKLFYNGRNDIEIYHIEFSAAETSNLINDFAPGKNSEFNLNNGKFGLRENLIKKIQEDNRSSDFLGFDLIGVECDGSFHSFYCHDITGELKNNLGLTLNEHGLIKDIPDYALVKNYLNQPETALEPVPWYIVKVNKYK